MRAELVVDTIVTALVEQIKILRAQQAEIGCFRRVHGFRTSDRGWQGPVHRWLLQNPNLSVPSLPWISAFGNRRGYRFFCAMTIIAKSAHRFERSGSAPVPKVYMENGVRFCIGQSQKRARAALMTLAEA